MKTTTLRLDTVTISIKNVDRSDSDLDQGSLTLTSRSGEQLAIQEAEIEAWFQGALHRGPALFAALLSVVDTAEELLDPHKLPSSKLRREEALQEAIARCRQLQGSRP